MSSVYIGDVIEVISPGYGIGRYGDEVFDKNDPIEVRFLGYDEDLFEFEAVGGRQLLFNGDNSVKLDSGAVETSFSRSLSDFINVKNAKPEEVTVEVGRVKVTYPDGTVIKCNKVEMVGEIWSFT